MDDAGMVGRNWAPLLAALIGLAACSGSSDDPDRPSTSSVPTVMNPVASAGSGAVASPTPRGTAAGAPGTGIGTPETGLAGRSGGAPTPTPMPPASGGSTPIPPPPASSPMTGMPAGTPMTMTPAPAGGAPTEPVAPTPRGKNCLKPGNGNYTSPGPYKVTKKDVDLGMVQASQHTGKYTIYYPDPLEASCPHPIVAWGNGTGVTDSDFTYDFLNSNAASWGVVVASSSEDNTGSGAFHKAGIDYLLKENMTQGSMFFQKLSTRAGVSGHSQGGFGAGLGASHPNVEAVVVEGASFVATAKVAGLTLTGTMDLGSGAADAVKNAQGKMFVGVWEGGNHVGTETVLGFLGLDTTSGDAMVSQRGSQQFQRLYAAWFRCFLADDDAACKLFAGPAPDACGICKEPGWNRLANKNM